MRAFKTLYDIRPTPKDTPLIYGRVRRLKSLTSDMEIEWQYQRRVRWVKPWRITLVADDQAGIAPEEVARILGRCRHYRFVLVELAIDFECGLKVNREFVKRHGVFGKSRRRTDRGGKNQLRYGARKSGKLVRCYWKEKIKAFRVEVELHSQLLKKHQVKDVDYLSYVAQIVHPRHFRFVNIRWKALHRYLRRRGDVDADTIIQGAHERAEVSLNNALKYLRRNGVINTHRFLQQLRLNDSIDTALTTWSLDFNEGLNV